MSDIAIQAEGLSKRYRIGSRQAAYATIQEAVTRAATAPLRRFAALGRRQPAARPQTHVWALRDVSFEIGRGEVVGVVGRNGAGKSTLLKILSRITSPSEGAADVFGRVSSLLEVGSGFHQELTGRENIFLNGAILGMKRAEIHRKLDDIVDFAELSKFIDTPVKRYSSGMYMRLAFAVAAHLEPDILLVDEVLAVGDVAFQKKCLGKMEDVARLGRTVLFVSHNIAALRSLCTHGMFLDAGRIGAQGSIEECIQGYMHAVGAVAQSNGCEAAADQGTSVFGPVRVNDGSGTTLRQGDPLLASTTIRIPQDAGGFIVHCVLDDMQGRRVFHLQINSKDLQYDLSRGRHVEVRFAVPPMWLNPGLYALFFRVVFWGGYGNSLHLSDPLPLDVDGTSATADSVLSPEPQWSVEPIAEDA